MTVDGFGRIATQAQVPIGEGLPRNPLVCVRITDVVIRDAATSQQRPPLTAIAEPCWPAAALPQPADEPLLLQAEPVGRAAAADHVELADSTFPLEQRRGPRPRGNNIDRLAEAQMELPQKDREQHDVAESPTAHDQRPHLRSTSGWWSKLGLHRHQRFARSSRATPYSRSSSCSISPCMLSTSAAAE